MSPMPHTTFYPNNPASVGVSVIAEAAGRPGTTFRRELSPYELSGVLMLPSVCREAAVVLFPHTVPGLRLSKRSPNRAETKGTDKSRVYRS